MSMPTQELQDLSMGVFTPSVLDRNFPFTDGTLSIPQLSDNVDPLPPPIREPIDSTSYSESDYDWLVNVLEALIKFIHRDENWSIPELKENDYAWAHALLVELVGAVGESETHPLRPVMEFVRQLIDNYEDKYVPELTELFPDLAEEAPIETANESKQSASDIPKQSESELAAHAFFCIGYLLYHGSRTEKAISAYDKATALKPDSWEASYNLGIAQYDSRQYTEAMVNFNKAIELNPNFASAYYNRGILKSELKDYEGAIADFNEALILKPDHVEAYNNRGIAKSKLNRHESAIADFNKVIGLHPKHANGYYNRGLGNNKIGNHQAAIDDFNKAINLNPNDAEAYYNRGYTNYQLGNHQTAIIDFDETIELDPNNFAAHYYRGVARQLLHNHQTAIDDLDKAIELKPDIAECYYCRGVAKKRLGNLQDAITDFNKAIEFGLNSAEVYLNRADAMEESGQHDEALADYTEAIRIKPDYAVAYYNRGNLEQRHRQYNEALVDYTEAIRIKPDFAEAYHNRGNLKRELGQYEAALADYTEAIHIKPDYAEAYANRGMAKVGLDRVNEAKSDLQTALELAEQRNNADLKAFVENQLQQLNQVPSKQNNKEPRRGGQMQTHIVTRVIDGDTLEISPEISRQTALQTPMERLLGVPLAAETPTERLSRPNMFHKIRLKNIDAPESSTPQGQKAIHYLKQLLEGKRVTFKPAGISYDRVVADVWRYPDHVFVNAIMVHSGHAKWSHPPR